MSIRHYANQPARPLSSDLCIDVPISCLPTVGYGLFNCLAFNQEKALVEAFSVIVNFRVILFEACSMAMTMLPCCHCCNACYCFRTRWGSTKALLTTWWPSPVIRSVVVMLQAAAKISHSVHEGVTSKQKHFALQTVLELSTGLREILQCLEKAPARAFSLLKMPTSASHFHN